MSTTEKLQKKLFMQSCFRQARLHSNALLSTISVPSFLADAIPSNNDCYFDLRHNSVFWRCKRILHIASALLLKVGTNKSTLCINEEFLSEIPVAITFQYSLMNQIDTALWIDWNQKVDLIFATQSYTTDTDHEMFNIAFEVDIRHSVTL